MSRTRRSTATLILGVVLLLAASALAVYADEPNGTPTATVVSSTPLPEEEETPTATATQTPAATATVTPTLDIAPTSTLTPTATVPAPTPTMTPLSTDTTHIAVLLSDTVVPVGGAANSEVFVSLVDVESDIQRVELVLAFDPTIVQVVSQGGVQVATNATLALDNERGQIMLSLDVPTENANDWVKMATIIWSAQQEGKSVVTIADATQVIASDGTARSPDATYDGVVFARAPGTIQGTVRLQGRENHEGVSVSSALSSVRFDRERTNVDGQFVIATSHGEGFYTIVVSMPGYLSAEGDRPVKMTVDSVIDVGGITLYGGDVNGDNRIDIRDLAYVAWHFDEYDTKADINQDGQVDILDLTLTTGNFGRLGPDTWHMPTPESG